MCYMIEIGDFEHPLDGPHPTDVCTAESG